MKVSRLVLALTILIVPLNVARTLDLHSPFWARARMPEISDEADPTDLQACYAMGQLNLTYESAKAGPPSVGLRITDPRGRRIGYDLTANRGWQELPFAQGFFDCDENESTSELRHCVGHIQICGPISGTYRVEVLPARPSKYSIKVSCSSQETRDAVGFHSTDSQMELKSEIQNLAPEILLLEYSRAVGTQTKLTRSDQHVARSEKGGTEESSR